MPDPDALVFFDRKAPWSKYKDLIIDYYLKPYLAKVFHLGKPILIVDCFAGAGRFKDGNPGSPLIICNRLAEAHDRGATVVGMFIEEIDELYDQLVKNLGSARIAVRPRRGSFRDYIQEIEQLAATHTIFLYLDPLKPSHLLFDDMKPIYDMLRRGRSVEALINFISPGVIRLAQGMEERTMDAGSRNLNHDEVKRCTAICGGDYWEEALAKETQSARVDFLADGYQDRLRQHFKFVLKYAVRESYDAELPKYHLMFGSRIEDAVALMNDAMVTARREFIGVQFPKGDTFFDMTPEEEVPNPQEIQKAVVITSQSIGRITWRLLRTQAMINHPCRYKESEFNKAIKAAINAGHLLCTGTGTRIEDGALVWIPDEVDRASGATSPWKPVQ